MFVQHIQPTALAPQPEHSFHFSMSDGKKFEGE